MKAFVRSFDRQFRAALAGLLLIMMIACEDFVEVDPPETEIVRETVYSSDGTAYSAIAGVYSEMVTFQSFAGGGDKSITMLAGLSADEFIGSYEDKKIFESNSLNSNNQDVKSSVWDPGFKLIYFANAILEGVANSAALSSATKRQLEGEAKFIRAFCYFYMVNLFGDVPIITTTDYRVNASLARSPQTDVYDSIIKDLMDAKNLLPNDYMISSNERVRPNKFAAAALLARVYLFKGDWESAELEATTIINEITLYSLVDDPDQVFLKGSKEAIWQLKPVSPGYNTYEGKTFDDRNFVSLRNSVLDLFEPADERNAWLKSTDLRGTEYHHPFKYKVSTDGQPLTEYSIVLRLAEQYLIRAEARVHTGNIAGAQDDVNTIRNRSELPDTDVFSESDLMSEIERQRQIEFVAEWGHRWLDLKRWNRANSVLGILKGDNWQLTDVLYPIPHSERQNNPNLSQNDGY